MTPRLPKRSKRRLTSSLESMIRSKKKTKNLSTLWNPVWSTKLTSKRTDWWSCKMRSIDSNKEEPWKVQTRKEEMKRRDFTDRDSHGRKLRDKDFSWWNWTKRREERESRLLSRSKPMSTTVMSLLSTKSPNRSLRTKLTFSSEKPQFHSGRERATLSRRELQQSFTSFISRSRSFTSGISFTWLVQTDRTVSWRPESQWSRSVEVTKDLMSMSPRLTDNHRRSLSHTW